MISQTLDGKPAMQYVACHVYLSERSSCVLELLKERADNTQESDAIFSSQLSLRILNLLTQWVGYEMQLLEQEDQARQKSAYAHQQLQHITPREREVLLLVADGESNKSMARILGISPKTVEQHRSSLLHKTSSPNSTQLVKLAVLAGLTD